ncbi:membrane protein insertion efficiency factor YidD [bacterium]|nr:membrane protein insertion efficiency factor YidD [bacterium]
MKRRLISLLLLIKQALRFLLKNLKNLLRLLLRGIIHLVSLTIFTFRPLLGPASCKFSIGCTQYALLQLEQPSFLIALKNITLRLVRCNPFTK